MEFGEVNLRRVIFGNEITGMVTVMCGNLIFGKENFGSLIGRFIFGRPGLCFVIFLQHPIFSVVQPATA